MYCSSCGKEIPGESRFCPYCGREMSINTRDDSDNSEEAPQYQQVNQGSSQQSYVSSSSKAYQKGCVSAAWSDYHHSKGWVGKTFLLSLINCVPILNFLVNGYILDWSREVPYGGRTSLPRRYFTGSYFKIGFFFFVISLVFGIVIGIVGSIVSYIPLIGMLIYFVLFFVEWMFLGLSGLRLAMSDSIGEGFSLGKLWDAFKRKWTELFCAVFPIFVAQIIIGLIIGLFLLLYGGSILLLAMGYVDEFDVAVSWDPNLLFVAIPLLLVIYYLCNVVLTATALISYRAVGHYVGRYANEWTREFPVLHNQDATDDRDS